MRLSLLLRPCRSQFLYMSGRQRMIDLSEPGLFTLNHPKPYSYTFSVRRESGELQALKLGTDEKFKLSRSTTSSVKVTMKVNFALMQCYCHFDTTVDINNFNCSSVHHFSCILKHKRIGQTFQNMLHGNFSEIFGFMNYRP